MNALHIEMWPPVADTTRPPAQIADIAIQGGEVSARVASPTRGVQMQRDRLPADGVLYMANIPLFLELFQRHVHLAVGATTTIPALWLFSGGAVDTVHVSRPSLDSLLLRFPDVEYALELAPDRSILSAVTRVRPGTDGEASHLVRRDCR